MMWKWLIVALVAAEPAGAAVMRAVYTGTIGGIAVDETGVFGPAGADLAGERFEAAFVYDTAIGRRSRGPTFDSLGGVAFLGQDVPVLSVSLRIGSGRYRFVPDTEGVAAIATDGATLILTEHEGVRDAVAGNLRHEDYLSIGLRAEGVLLPDLEARLRLDDDDDFFQGSFVSASTNLLTGDRLRYAGGSFLTDAVTIAPVPLPAPVALLGAGLGLLAVAARHRATR
jgi:hypothetical protein